MYFYTLKSQNKENTKGEVLDSKSEACVQPYSTTSYFNHLHMKSTFSIQVQNKCTTQAHISRLIRLRITQPKFSCLNFKKRTSTFEYHLTSKPNI